LNKGYALKIHNPFLFGFALLRKDIFLISISFYAPFFVTKNSFQVIEMPKIPEVRNLLSHKATFNHSFSS